MDKYTNPLFIILEVFEFSRRVLRGRF